MRTGLYCVWVLCCVVIHHPGPAVAQGGGGMATTATTDMATQTEPGSPEATCLPELAAAVLWNLQATSSRVASNPCGRIHPKLRGGAATRTCSAEGVWSDIDFSGCTLPSGTNPGLLLWIPLLVPRAVVQNSSQAIIQDLYSVLQLESLQIQVGVNFTLENILETKIDPVYSSVLLLLTFSQAGSFTPERVAALEANLGTLSGGRVSTLGGIAIAGGTRLGFRGFSVVGACSCQPSTTLFREVCAGSVPRPPCTCGEVRCSCNGPDYVGDGVMCAPDVDGDSFPTVLLESCNSTQTQTQFCALDNCPLIYNPRQDVTRCVAPRDFDGCPLVRGTRINILWGNTERGVTDMQRCPNARGFATRRCLSNGQWDREEDVTQCMSYEFDSAFTLADSIFMMGNNVPLRDRLLSASDVTTDILSLTAPETVSLLPTDLNSTNLVLAGVIELLEESLDSAENTSDISNSDVLDIFSNVLEGSNLDGWLELTQIGDGTPKLLDNIERYALYQARDVQETDFGRRLWQRNNIAISFLRASGDDNAPVKFPEVSDDLSAGIGFDSSDIPAQIELPPTLFRARKMRPGSRIPSSSFLVRNMELAMPTTTEDGEEDMQIASMIISAQVNERGETTPELADNPVKIMFQFDPVENASSYVCAYWKFSEPIGNGYWAYDGVSLSSVESVEDKMMVNCSATHLTSFAVLVDVSGSLTNIGEVERQALQIVSYIGCAISVVFLFITIIFFLAQGRDLCLKVHYFVHLNLSISLFLAYLLFVVGGETATAVKEACITVAAVLHYLFLASFFWMLCEGVMLYLLLVVVFSRLSKNVWFFLILGYVVPVVPVIVSVGIRYEDYGVRDVEGNLTFCWLSTENGVIWAFTGPMLAVILVNLFFMIVALTKVYKTKRSARKRSTIKRNFSKRELDPESSGKKEDENKKMDFSLFKATFVAIVVLLPMLGITWVLGLFAVNQNTTVFAWIFAIANSLQGFFIFIFHVVRSDKVWRNPRAERLRSSMTYKFKRTSSSVINSSDLASSNGKHLSRTSTSNTILCGDNGSPCAATEESVKLNGEQSSPL